MVLAKDFPGLDLTRARVVLVEALDRLLATFHPLARRARPAHARGAGRRGAARAHRRGGERRRGPPRRRLGDPDAHARVGGRRARRTRCSCRPRAARRSDRAGARRARPARRGPARRVRHRRRRRRTRPARARPTRSWRRWRCSRAATSPARSRAAGRRSPAPRRFRYFDKGTHGDDRAQLAPSPSYRSGLRFRGFIAWLMWLGLHLVYLIGFRNRTSVLLNWAWNYVTYDRGARLIVDAESTPDAEPTMSRRGAEAGRANDHSRSRNGSIRRRSGCRAAGASAAGPAAACAPAPCR